MVQNTLIFSLSLIVLGMVTYVLTGMASVTALIPSFLGVVFLAVGIISMKPSLRRHAMHAAAALSLLVIVALGVRVAGASDFTRPAVIAQILTLAMTVAFLVLCVRSFIAARKARKI